ncbi:MAG TPA: immune inhibitor A domain-containing protein [Dermatophilaceae bacterium]|nr:immune inhibitor A domain-containing protein [Dermatophilaceae bacterium]
MARRVTPLSVPDLDDTAGGDNSTGFWTLMSAGSWLNHGTDSIGATPGYFGPSEKLQMGWLDYKQVNYGKNAVVKLGPAERTGTLPQAILVNLPDKTIVTDYNTPHSGLFEWWGGSADNLNTTLSRTVDPDQGHDVGDDVRMGQVRHRGGLRPPLR